MKNKNLFRTRGSARWLITLIALLILGVGQMWADNEYNKRYLYVNSSDCSWWTDASSQPALNAYFNTNCSDDWAAFKGEADGELTSTSWYIDLYGMHASYLYFRGFKIERHPKSTENYWNAVTAGAEGNSAKNCLWINSDGNGMTWGYYAPPMSASTLSDNGTTLSWGGSGTSVSPYLIPTSSTIKLTASSTSSVSDATMTAYYQYKDDGTEIRSGSTTATYDYTASSTTGTSHIITVEAYNDYNSGSYTGTHLASSAIYYETRTPYTISYDKGTNGTGTRASETKLKGVNFTLPNSAVFTRTGYTHTSWATSDGGSTAYALGGSYTTDAAQTFYPVWTAKTYSITLSKNGSGSADGSATATYDGGLSSISAPTYSGYHVEGYYKEAELTNKIANSDGTLRASTAYTNASSKWTQDGAVTLYAKWEEDAAEYDVTFGVGTSYTSLGSLTATADASSISSGDDITAGAEVVFTASPNSYYEVAGFYSDASCTSSLQSGSSTTYTIASLGSDVTVYVKFQPITYTITYNLNGGSNGANPSSYTYESSKIDLADPSKSGYTFAGWYKESTFVNEVTNIAAGSNGNKTFWANWTENDYTVTVTAGSNGSVAYDEITGHKDTKETLPTATPNTGYHFDTWTTTTGSVTYTNQTSADEAQVNGLTAAATVRADFAANTYEVAFNNNNGTGTMSNESFTYDASAKALTTNTFTKSGYTFIGWATTAERAAALTVDYTNGQSVQNLTSTNNGTYNLYAVWAKDYFIGGRFQHDWEDGTTTTNEMTYDATTGYYKFETSKTVNELSVQWHNVSGDYYANQQFFIHTGNGKVGSSSNPFYTTPNEDGAGLNFETCNSYANALVLANQETTWGEIVSNRCIQFSNTDNLSSNVIVWWDPANKKVWYTATESLNTNYYLLGFGSGNWSETDARRFTVASVNATTATVTVALTAKTYTGTNDGFKVKNGSTWYGNAGNMTRANCTGWVFSSGADNCAITADLADDYTFTLNLSTMQVSATYPTESGFTVTTTSSAGGSADAASYTAYEFTTTAISATPNTGYYFTGWEATSGSVTFADASSASTTINGVTAAATIRANFAPMWVIAGGDSGNSDNGDDVMGNWSTSANQIVNIGTNANSKDTGYVEITLPANTNFYFKVKDVSLAANAGWYGNNTSTQFMTYAANNKQPWQFGTDGSNTANCGITTAGAGTYKFAWNITDKTLTVYFPTSYSVTFGQGTGNGTAVTATGSTSGSITSGQYVAAGENVTFTQTPSTGYTFKGWYTTSDGNTAVTGMGTSDAVYDDIVANINVYAQYTEDMHTVTVTAGEHGSITTPAGGSGSTVSAGIATGAAIVAAVADYGYYFQGWTVESGSATFANASALSTTVYATADATIKANFVSHWTIAGGDSGDALNGSDAMGNWSEVANGIDHFTEIETDVWEGYAEIDLPANTTFYFKVRDLFNTNWYGNTGEMTINNSTGWEMSKNESTNCRITTAGKGTYRFTWNETTKHLTVTYPTSYTVSYSVYTFLGNDESNSESTTGGSISSVVDGDAIALTSGKYVVSGGTAVFTHSAPTANYHFTGWYSDAACTTAYVDGEGDAAITDEVLTLTVSGNKTVYAKFAENMTTVNIAHNTHGHVELGGETITSLTAGTVTTRSITAVADAGWYFAGWTVTSGTDFTPSATSEDNTTITVSGRGAGETTGQTLTANFVELEKVYFRNWNADSNEPLWENVYAYFSISYENNCAKSNSSDAYSGVLMTREGTSNIYWAYVPRGTTRNGDDDIAFSDYEFETSFKFYQHEAVMRGDYKTGWNMFVPQHSNSSTVNETKYYNGYWKHHNAAVDSDAGYRIERYTGSGYVTPADNGADRLKFLVASENTIQYQLRIDNTTSGYNNYMIYNVGGTHYLTFDESPVVTGDTITSSNFRNFGLSEYNSGSPRFYITPTSEGIYTLTIDMSGDVMKLSVNYPISVGDHRLKHTYTSGSAKYTYSDVIKSYEDTKKLSMYLNNTTSYSPSLKLQKCTALTNGVPTWGSETSVTMTGVKADTMGVFVFDLAVDGDAGSISNTAPYTGEYYIKADSLPGNWTNYTQNVMENNTSTFDKATASTYDYYFCHWYGNRNNTYNTNVKCVIANEYNNQLTDTLYGDAILGGADKEHQTLPLAANVRFSYNSTTNEVKRAYINGVSGWEPSFLSLQDAKILGASTASTIKHTNEDALTEDTVSFVDMNDWIYQRDVLVHPTARGRLTANYKYNSTDHIQYLIGTSGDISTSTTSQLIGGSSDTDTWLKMRLIYDFKTNNLIAGYLVNTDTEISSATVIAADMLLIRQNQNAAEQVSLSGSGKLTQVDTVYGIMQFNKSTILDGTKSIYERGLYMISFPFDVNLKDVFGFGEYGKHWIISYYDGAERARKGFWAESNGFWKYVMPSQRESYTLKANVGYILSLDLDEMTSVSPIWGNSITSVSLYFPSNDSVRTIDNTLTSIEVPAHTCTITRDHRDIWDSNWNMIGVPSYANVAGLIDPDLGDQKDAIKGGLYDVDNLGFYYGWDPSTNTLGVTAAESTTFLTMNAYLVQFAGTLNWSTRPESSVAARRVASEQEKDRYTLDLHVSQNGADADHTYVELRDDATESYDMNIDLVKANNAGVANLYTIVDGVSMGANCLPVPAHSTVVPVGLTTVAAADYTFSMPAGTEGIGVTLIDYTTGTETNLALGDYTVTLPKGTYSERFALRINRQQVVTAIETTEDSASQSDRVEKVIIDGKLFIRKADGSVFDAQGKRVR